VDCGRDSRNHSAALKFKIADHRPAPPDAPQRSAGQSRSHPVVSWSELVVPDDQFDLKVLNQTGLDARASSNGPAR
jgi:hypothetical protein